MTTITIASTGTTETIADDTLAIGCHAFARIYGETYRGAELPQELHITENQPESEEVDAIDDDLRARGIAVSSLAASGRGYVLFVGQGVDGCDVWALCDIAVEVVS